MQVNCWVPCLHIDSLKDLLAPLHAECRALQNQNCGVRVLLLWKDVLFSPPSVRKTVSNKLLQMPLQLTHVSNLLSSHCAACVSWTEFLTMSFPKEPPKNNSKEEKKEMLLFKKIVSYRKNKREKNDESCWEPSFLWVPLFNRNDKGSTTCAKNV